MDKSLIIKEIKKHYNIKSDADFARHIGISTQNMYTWIKRNTYDATTILAKCPELSAEWLLTGEGEMLKKEKQISAVNSDIISMPTDVWTVISNQAESLKSKDKQIDIALAQTTEVIELLKEQLKKGQDASKKLRAVNSVVEEGE